MAHPNEDLLRRGYEAFSKGDFDTLRQDFAEDIVWHSPGNNPLSGEYRGQDEVFGFFAKIAEITGGTFQAELHDVLVNDEHSVALQVTRAEREGNSLETHDVGVFHVRDGKITEAWFHSGDQAALDEFLS
jgi:hypothetical protein